MPDAPEQITLVRDGHAIRVPIDRAGQLVTQGYTVESKGGQSAREERELYKERDPGLATSIAMGVLRGGTLGLSDVAVRATGGEDAAKRLRDIEGYHPIGSAAGQILGTVATGGLGTTGAATSAGEAIGGTAGKLATGAIEGAAQNAGNYVSDVALSDKQLSAEGFVGAMGKGALWGTGASGGILGTEKGLAKARSMFPKGELTREAVAKAEGDAVNEIGAARRDADALGDAAHQRMRGIREEVGADPRVRAEHEAIAADATRQMAAEANPQAALEQATGAPPVPTPVDKAAVVAGKAGGKAIAQAIAPEEAAAEPDQLLAQLQATKQKLEGGASLGTLSKRPTAVEDAVNDHVAKTHPEMQRISRAERELSDASKEVDSWLGGEGATPEAGTRKQAVQDWIKQTRPTEAGYYSRVPEGEGNLVIPRGRETEFRGSELDKSLAELDTLSKFERGRTVAEKLLSPREGEKPIKLRGAGYEAGIKGKSAAEAVPGKPGSPVTAQDVIDASNAQLADRGLSPLDAQIEAAVRKKINPKFANEDVSKAIASLERFERAHAEVVDALGTHAPPSTIARAHGFRAAEEAASTNVADATAKAAADVDKQPGMLSRAKGMIDKVGEATELLHMMGVNSPDPRDVPVVGPLLSLYLKARIGARVLGKVVGSPEGAIAKKAAGMRDKVQNAVAGALDAAQKGVSRVAPIAPTAAVVLQHALFAGPKAKGDDLPSLYEARSAELAEAQRPGAIEDAIRQRTGSTDGALVQAIADTQRAKLSFLDSKRPKPAAPSPFEEKAWTPDKQRMLEWSRYVAAADHPEDVFAQIERGQMPTHEALETVRTVYPRLWQEAQQHLVTQLAKGDLGAMPYARRVMLSVVFNVPIDASMAPGFGQFLSTAHPQGTPAAPSAPPPGQPTIHADVNLGARVDPTAKAS